MLCDIVSKGGNFLLNVGPKGDGTIPQESVERLRRMGEWMRVNGGAIYGTTASPFPRKFPWGRVSQKPGPTSGRESTTLNLMVFDWPKDGKILLTGISNEPFGARVLGVDGATDPGDGAVSLGGVRGNARARRTMQGIEIAGLPATPPDPDASVVQVFIAGKPEIAPAYVVPGQDGAIACMAADATVTGSIQYEGRYDNLGWWRDTASTASWKVLTPRGRRYKVSIDYAANPACGGDVEVTVGSTVLRAALPGRSDWGDFGRVEVGEADIPGEKPVEITVRAERKPGEAFINLRDVRLVPTSVLGK
jgi:alpha-L-fucosidase